MFTEQVQCSVLGTGYNFEEAKVPALQEITVNGQGLK